MNLNNLNVGDVCITAYQDFNNANILKAVSIVSKKYSDGSAKLSDIVGLNQEVLAKGWVADDTTTTIKKVLFNQKMSKALKTLEVLEALESLKSLEALKTLDTFGELVKKKLREDFPEYIL